MLTAFTFTPRSISCARSVFHPRYAGPNKAFSPTFVSPYVEWVGLGLIVPGLLANQFDRQGVLPTLLMLAIAAPLVRLILVLVVRL